MQQSDAGGNLSFVTVFPGCYDGRMPHMHFEVYATSGYATSVGNLARVSFGSGNVFSDGVTLQLAAVTGNVTGGCVATWVVGTTG